VFVEIVDQKGFKCVLLVWVNDLKVVALRPTDDVLNCLEAHALLKLCLSRVSVLFWACFQVSQVPAAEREPLIRISELLGYD